MTDSQAPDPAAKVEGHTPTPWELGEWIRSDGGAVFRQVFGPGRRLASVSVYGRDRNGSTGGRTYKDALGTWRKSRTITEAECDANARLIVRACNNHAALVARLREVVASADDQGAVILGRSWLNAARAALDAAESKP